ncbi:SGNH/GDSL hydrolase family protein [Carboxylicivirga sp. A043]|uniref:SGNH/GDSL hydrolase family protein n=1 Tax=Carboxylicivirga litoralis TaxID=2816963 RepID=UPI0021CB17FB|nr:SGNH/GDSL hydrolase family protein [Carboxylicivirga sp. A043]MCU4154493.1 SGNH/GDSL hydrolase family protein [Carboxylicivirga sp. A043]
MKLTLVLLLCMLIGQTSYGQDWANLNRYKDDNLKIGLPKAGENRVVFMGNSITDAWINHFPTYFSDNGYVDRGISGQTTPQMLVRFRADVIKLKPTVVTILAGTNDIAGNTGPSTLEMIADNIFSMAELAKANRIKVILCSVLPVYDYPWKPGLNPASKIVTLNEMIKAYADSHDLYYLDYYSSMVDSRQGMKKEYSEDGVHPNKAGYEVMMELCTEAIEQVLADN